MKAYCIFCKTGLEKNIALHINSLHPEATVISPARVLMEKKKGQWTDCEKPLIPGYIFIYSEEEPLFDKIKALTDVYKVLSYQDGTKELMGADLEYANWLYKHNGKIGPSKALVEGSTVKVTDGPLKDGIGKIIRLDRHKRRAWVEFEFAGKKQKVSLSVVDITVGGH